MQGLDTDSDLGLTHNQAAQKASEEHLRNNGGRLFPEECVPDSQESLVCLLLDVCFRRCLFEEVSPQV